MPKEFDDFEKHTMAVRVNKGENINDKLICEECGCDTFMVYITIIIDDARLYCANCGYNQL